METDGTGTESTPGGTGTESTPDGTDSGVDMHTQSSHTFVGSGLHTKPTIDIIMWDSANQPLSFLPQKSPKKVDTTKVR